MVERIRSSIGANPGLVLIEKFTNLKKLHIKYLNILNINLSILVS